MRKATKICLIAALVFGVIGIGIIVIGFVSGMSLRDNSNTSLPNQYEFNGDEIKNIDACINAGSLTIKESDKDKISVEVIYRNHSKRDIEVKKKNDTLKIDESHKFFNGHFSNNSIEIMIYLPENIQLKDVDLQVNAGEIQVEKLSVNDTLKVDVNAGSAKFKNIKAAFIEAGCNVGNIDMDIDYIDNMDLECNVGDIRADIKENVSKYDYEINNDVGSVEINGKRYRDYYEDEDSDNIIKAKCNIGDIKLYLQED